ncbi:MAG: aminodeoxychorismate synthase component I [Desulfobacteraceae bacterium]|nr:aminodeoxychorismate synthase component I [Desulfobacteraceae bacterium]
MAPIEIQAFIEKIPPISEIYTEKIELNAGVEDIAAPFATREGTVVLMSGGNLDCARYHVMGIDPRLSVKCRGLHVQLTIDDTTTCYKGNSMDVLRMLIRHFHTTPPVPAMPLNAGILGYISYDFKDQLENLPRTSVDDLHLPQVCFYLPRLMVVHDKSEGISRLFIPIHGTDGRSSAIHAAESFKESLDPAGAGIAETFSGDTRLQSNFNREDYLQAVSRIREYIAAGDVYQVNLSQRFEAAFSGSSYAFFQSLYRINPAPFFAFVNAGDHQIISSSPERFVMRKGDLVETRPIKGTRPRGNKPEEDKRLRTSLINSEKDDAELSMIVDLLRNDIGKVCVGGSVHVDAHRQIEAYENVWHSVSIISGTLSPVHDALDLIQATFPGGSITGCPKIRAMEIIDELEPHRRHIYTGSIGYLGFHDTMDFSIAIRTATVVDGRIIFSVGGGIVFDSDPADEFAETLHKGRSLMQVFSKNDRREPRTTRVWWNGRMVDESAAVVPVNDQGLLYGFGLFETIRAEKGLCRLLLGHLARFNRSWETLFSSPPPDLTWEHIISQVLTENRLENRLAKVKLLATAGNPTDSQTRHTLVVTAGPYIHRLSGLQKAGLDTGCYPERRQTPLAGHKTLNYLYYHQAGQWADHHGYDEAIILNPDRTVSETNTANLLLISGNRIIRPKSACVLPGVTADTACRLLARGGYTISTEALTPDDMFRADLVLVTNSLMGVVPVLSVDGRRLKSSQSIPTPLDPLVFPQ